MENGGWIKLHRQFLNWEWHDSPSTAYLFVVLLLLANHDDEKWHGLVISRGQCVTSRDKLAEICGLSVRQVRTALGRLQGTGEIIIKTTSKFTLVSICNYAKYQVEKESVRPTNDQQTTSKRPTNDQQTTTNKNDKNISINNTLSLEQCPQEKISEDWRVPLSSMRKSALGFDKDRIAAYKRELFERELIPVAEKYKMPRPAMEAFLRWWTAHDPGVDKIKAEDARPFDMETRVLSWMEHERPKVASAQKKSRVEEVVNSYNQVQDWIHGRFSSSPEDGYADSQFGQ